MEDLACYRELWAKPADNIQDSYLYEFIFEACRFFSNKKTKGETSCFLNRKSSVHLY